MHIDSVTLIHFSIDEKSWHIFVVTSETELPSLVLL